MTETGELLSTYEELAIAWDSEVNARRANRIFDRIHAIALELRSLEEGRHGLESLLSHRNRGVRLSAAGDCLAWGSEAAIEALEGLIIPRGTHSLSAEMTIRDYQAGRMRFDW
jgi:hypothetical protein